MDANTTVVNALGEVTLGHVASGAQMGFVIVLGIMGLAIIMSMFTRPRF